MTGERILGVLAGKDQPLETVRRWAESANIVIAADGAANGLVQVGVVPHHVVGDLDSLDPQLRPLLPDVVEDSDQETTDCDKLLAFAARQGADSITLVGLEGDRLDHVIGATHSALRSALNVRLALRRAMGYVVPPGPALLVPSRPGQTVSFLPMVECLNVEMLGVFWPPKRTLSPLGATSISNAATGKMVSIQIETGVGILILTRDSDEPIW